MNLYFGPLYLYTVSDVEENAIATLGSFEKGNYEDYETKMSQIAKINRILHPTMAIGLRFKKEGFDDIEEQARPLSKNDWSNLKTCKHKFESISSVYVIDSSKFAFLYSQC